MSVIDALARLWKRNAEHYVVAGIPPERQDVKITETTVLSEQHYFRTRALHFLGRLVAFGALRVANGA